jgi:sugar lactone lactonase YvrE
MIRKVDKQGIISSIAGTGICGFSGDKGPAIQAKISLPWGLALDAAGNIFFVDYGNQRIRAIDKNGIIVTVAGSGQKGYCGDGGPATKACFNYPSAIAVAGSGSSAVLFIADTSNERIRQVSLKTGLITTVAGNGQQGYSGDGGPAKNASFYFPQGVAVDSRTHVLWIADTFNSAIRRVDSTGTITTFVVGGFCDLDVCFPVGMKIDPDGNLLVASDLWVLKVAVPSGAVTLEAGVEAQGFNGDGHPALATEYGLPYDVAFDNAGNLFTVDTIGSRIREGALSQNVTTVAGGYIGDHGPATSAFLNDPAQSAVDKNGNLYIADQFNHRIRKVTAGGTISTFAGTGFSGYSGDGGPAARASLNFPTGLTIDRQGNVFIGDWSNLVIRKVDRTGTITTFSSGFANLVSLATDNAGNVYAMDFCEVWKVAPDGTRTAVAGSDSKCGYNGDEIPATQALLKFPYGVAVDSHGNVYIADRSNQRVRMVDTSGIIHTIAGTGTCGFSGDGGAANAAMVCLPASVAVDGQHNVYIGDSGNLRIRVIDASGQINTLAGTGNPGYNGDGLPALRTNVAPLSVGVTLNGIVYFSDSQDYRVRIVH